MNNESINKVISISENEEEWNHYLQLAGGGDIYHSPKYHRIHENYYKAKALATVVQEDDKVFFHPYILHPVKNIGTIPLSNIIYDIQSVYGYSGPIVSSKDLGFLEKAWNYHFKWCHGNNVVAEFIRFNPILNNHLHAQGQYEIVKLRKTIYLNLPGNIEHLLDNYSSVQRNMIKKAQKVGLSVFEASLDEFMGCFQDIYISTMKRLKADDQYYFDSEYFSTLITMKDNVKLFLVKYMSQIIAGALFLTYNKRMHYHLSGCNDKYQQLGGINNYILHEAACWGIRNGYEIMHLGGGLTNEPSDSLLKFKQSISKDSFNYFIGKKIHNSKIYEEFSNMWGTQNKAKSSHFLFYRQ